MKILLVIPPFIQINTPYPSTVQLAGYLNAKGYNVESFDLSLSVILRIFSKEGLINIFDRIHSLKNKDEHVKRTIALKEHYVNVIEPVISFLQGKDQNLAYRIVKEGFLPHGESFVNEIDELSIFGNLGLQDKAKYYCSLVIDDLTKIIQRTIAPHFGLSRYAERIAVSPPFFDPILNELTRVPNFIEQLIIEETNKKISQYTPDVMGYTIPFPGNLLGALVSSRHVKAHYPHVKIIFGGGYINTELRELKDHRIFDFTDFITYDDGELPLHQILINMEDTTNGQLFVRTLKREGRELVYIDNAQQKNIPHDDVFPPYLNGINPGNYISMTEMLNPMHRLWSDGYWNKLNVAHGCYWRKCTFCDITLDYINRYSPARASTVVNWMEEMIKQTGKTAFHFTDEAAPPSVLKEIAIEILNRKLNVTWWGNIRFEKTFTADLCRLLAASGCVAVSGGLEVADERLLLLINKGVTLRQVANVCNNFKNSGIMVHAYLMYGFPTQTEQELINSLEFVRQFIKHNLFQSGFWHLFTLTTHSPIAKDPDKFQIKIESPASNMFANNDLVHTDLSGIDYSKYSSGLKKALYNFMHGIGLDWNVTKWFDFKTPNTNINRNLINTYIRNNSNDSEYHDRMMIIWNGTIPVIIRKDNSMCEVSIHNNLLEGSWKVENSIGEWILNISENTTSFLGKHLTYGELKESFPGGIDTFISFKSTEFWKEVKENFLLIV